MKKDDDDDDDDFLMKLVLIDFGIVNKRGKEINSDVKENEKLSVCVCVRMKVI
jgi:hypothetical protein